MSTATVTKLQRRATPLCSRVPSTDRPHENLLGVRLVAGDEDVIADLYQRYGGRVMSLAWRLLNDRELAEEVVQETIVRVWHRRGTFDATRDLEPWLFRIARNTAYDMGRARTRRPRAQRGDPTPALDSLPAGDDASDPGIATETLALQWEVRAAIDDLPETEREVVRLQHLDGMSHSEIAERLGISLGTVKSRSHRAHRRLASSLRKLRALTADCA